MNERHQAAPKSSRTGHYSAPAAACAADLLIAFGRAAQPQSLSELTRTTGVSKSLAFRVLRELESRELVTRGEDGRFTLGVSALELAGSYLQLSGLGTLARGVLRDLASESGDTADLAVLRGAEILYVMKEEGPHAYPTISHVGKRLPANCSALGKVLLSKLDDKEIVARFAGSYPQLTPKSASSWEELKPMIEEARTLDYAVNMGEAISGRGYVASAVHIGTEWAAIGVSANESSFRESQVELIASLRRARERVARELAARASFVSEEPELIESS